MIQARDCFSCRKLPQTSHFKIVLLVFIFSSILIFFNIITSIWNPKEFYLFKTLFYFLFIIVIIFINPLFTSHYWF